MGRADLSMGKTSVARYGKKEVESWYWELWNEPDIGYWEGTMQEYFKLYDYSADAVKTGVANRKDRRTACNRSPGKARLIF